jgi:hypothetical protein
LLALRRAVGGVSGAVTLLTVAPRFCGPPASANGGYFAGMVAALASGPVRVRLRRPPPLAVAMPAEMLGDGRIVVRHAGETVAEALPATPELDVPAPVSRLEALEASRRFSGWRQHVFPRCFVCGPQRTRGDGLRIFAGEVVGRGPAGLVAAPWIPDASLALGDGRVASQYMWAALDCPGYFAVAPDGRVMLLAELTARLERRLRVDEPAIVVGWPLGGEGRMHEAGTALFGEDGELCGLARALWVEPRNDPRGAPPREA